MAVATQTKERGRVGTNRLSPGDRIGWVLPSCILVLFTLKPLGPVKDPDAFWHIVAGEHLWQTGQFVLTDPFGAATEKTWILNQWLPEVLMHRVYALAGLAGVAWLLCLGSALVGLAVLASCRRRASALVTALVAAVVFVAMAGSLSPRPQLVTFALTAVTTSAWLQTRRDLRVRWWLVPMTWVWACAHGMWFLGPVVGVGVVMGLLAERRIDTRTAARLGLVPLFSVVVAGLTPVGPRLFTSPFQVGGVTSMISEWQPPGLGDPGVLAALALVVLVVVDQARRVATEWTTVLLTLFALVLTLSWARTIAIAAVILAPLAAVALQRLTRQGQVAAPARREAWAVGVAGVAALGATAALASPVAAAPGIGPNALDTALSRIPAGAVVCNDQVDGGWLMLEHPGLKPTMDTRVELYSVQHIQHYLAFVAAGDGWQSYPDEVGCTYAVLPSDASVTPRLVAEQHWVVVDRAGGYALLRR